MTGAQRALARAQGVVLAGLLSLPGRVVRALAGAPVEIDEQELYPEAQLTLRLSALTHPPQLDTVDVDAARERVARDAITVGGRRPSIARVRPIRISGEPGRLQARLYTPAEAEEPAGMLVYFHGGGFVVGDLETHDHLCRVLALAAGVRVLAVDYRRAPEHRFPAAADDAWIAWLVAVENAVELGADRARLAVGGDSAGGNLAAGVAQRAARSAGTSPALQLLLYPWLDLTRRRRSHALFGEGFYLTTRDLDWYAGHYLGATGDRGDPRCSPLLAEDVSGVAPAYIATAGFDPLRDEGEEYAWRLRAAGVRVVLHRHAGLFHGFANTVGVGRAAREALCAAAGALRYALAP